MDPFATLSGEGVGEEGDVRLVNEMFTFGARYTHIGVVQVPECVGISRE